VRLSTLETTGCGTYSNSQIASVRLCKPFTVATQKCIFHVTVPLQKLLQSGQEYFALLPRLYDTEMSDIIEKNARIGSIGTSPSKVRVLFPASASLRILRTL
jgi:hypothetical protein